MLGKVLLIAPLRVCYMVWPAEIEKWLDFNGLKWTILHGKDKEECLNLDADIFLINPEGLDWLIGGKRLAQIKINRLVIDESSGFKHTKTKRFKLIKSILGQMRSRWCLTGSPAPNGYLDLFGQIYIMDLGNALGRYITVYKNTYFFPSGFGGYTWRLQPGAENKIQERIAPLVKVLDGETLLELPQIVNSTIYVELPKEARKAYSEMETLMLTKILGDDTITAASAAAASLKCRQIANGGIYKNEKDGLLLKSSGWVDLHHEKVNAVQERIDECQGRPAMVVYEFEHDLNRLLEKFGPTDYIGGGVSPQKSKLIGDQWNKGLIDKLFVQPASIAYGANLQGGPGNRIIFHSLIWNWEHYYQLIRRLRRQGSAHKRIFVDHIVAKGTVDEIILPVCLHKGKVEGGLKKALREYAERKLRSGS